MQTTDQRMMESAEGLVTLRQRRGDGHNRRNFNLDSTFELLAVVDFIISLPLNEESRRTREQRIALQFPDSMLGITVTVVERLQTLLMEKGRIFGARRPAAAATESDKNADVESLPILTKLFVLADNTYGDCCPDEVTAEHYFAHAIVHFGHACLSKSVRFPIHYVFSKMRNFNEEDTAKQIQGFFYSSSSSSAAGEDLVVVMSTPTVHHRENLMNCVRNLGLPVHTGGIAEGKGSGAVYFADFYVPYSQLPSAPAVSDACSTTGGGCCSSSSTTAGSTAVPQPKTEIDESVWTINGFKIPKQASSTTLAANKNQKLFFVGPADSPMIHQLSLIAMHNEMSRSGGDGNGSGLLRVVDPSGWSSSATASVVAASQLEQDKATATEESASEAVKKSKAIVDKRIRQRMFNMESLKKASSVGIIVASLAIEGFKETAEKLRSLLIKHKKRCYIIFIGHLSPLKTGNFVDSIDCFVSIACPNARVAQFTDNKRDEFLQPMLTPIEVLLTFGYVDFDSPVAFSNRFGNILEVDVEKRKRNDEGDGSEEEEDEDEDDAGAAALASGKTGQMINTRPLNVALAGNACHQSALERFNDRLYQGLDPLVGQTPVQPTIVQGKHGIARGYSTVEKASTEDAPSNVPPPSTTTTLTKESNSSATATSAESASKNLDW